MNALTRRETTKEDAVLSIENLLSTPSLGLDLWVGSFGKQHESNGSINRMISLRWRRMVAGTMDNRESLASY